MIRVGAVLEGYCGGYFGRDWDDTWRVEALGADWVVVRGTPSGRPRFAAVTPEDLEEYLEKKT